MSIEVVNLRFTNLHFDFTYRLITTVHGSGDMLIH